MHAFRIMALLPLAVMAFETTFSAKRAPLLCGEQQYDQSHYSCWNTSNGSSLLCPVIHGVHYRLCEDKCYYTYHYTCEGESPTLVPLPVRATPFTIITYSDNPSLRNRNLHPRDKRFYVDIDRNDEAHCSLEHLECTRSMNFTVFNPDSSLAVQAPGGQQTYIKTDGTMSFTEPQESAKPDMLYEPAGTAYQGGGFIGPNGTFWAACDDGTGAKYVVAVPGDEAGAPDGCERLNLWTMKRPQGTKGAYQYGI